MAIARAKSGLSAAELEGLRNAVTNGRKPKVTFTSAAGQIAGSQGQVIRFEDPGASDEWVVVRFGKDELPFAPSDLELSKPQPKAKVAPAEAPQKAETIEPPPWTPAAPAAAEPARAAAKQAEAVAASARPAARKAVAKRPAELTVTLTCQDNQWSVQAQRGTKVLVKALPVRASEALKMVALLDAEPVQAIVEEIVEAAREEAQQQAIRLREELQRVEATLADLQGR
jgi:hypothetical protein